MREEPMKLLLRRNQKTGMLGGIPTFTLDARAELSEPETGYVKKYKMGKTVLYQNYELGDRGKGLLGIVSRYAIKVMNISVSVDDLMGGKHIECKDILEMLSVEEQLRQACENFKAVLDAAAHFGGEEVVEI